MKNTRLSIVFLFGLSLSLIQCSNREPLDGPYFGNGVRNGWADQNSVVIWTRLTKNPEGNAGGEQFLALSKEEVDSLDENGDKEAIHRAQIPEGLTLEQMIGACPGKEGEVRLTYYATEHPENKIRIPWTKVDPEKNYTKQ